MDIKSRTMSGFPLSIGTAIAFESLFPPRQKVYDEKRKIPNHVDITQYRFFYINVYTLCRNIIGACDKNAVLELSVKDLADALYNEIQVIIDLLNNEGGGICTPVFYVCSYRTLELQLVKTMVLIRVPKTKRQRDEFIKINAAVKEVSKTFKDIQFWDSELKDVGSSSDILLLSQFPYDLVSSKKFKRMDLLESHTGVLKQKLNWWTKYYKLPDTDKEAGLSMSILPFNRKLLLIMGDNALIHPSDIKLRRMIVEIGKKRKWNPQTTEDKILFDLDLDIKDKFIVDTIKRL